MLLAETMEMLTSGEYSLNKKNLGHERKSILFVKLTDSAQKALSNYLRNLDSCDKPLIEFIEDQGRLLIPTSSKGSAEVDQYTAQFTFDVTSNDTMQGKQGRFECVQHKRGSKQLIKYGQLTQRLRIHANEDVYETTKNRMAAIELQQRKNCTVQLDWNSTTKTSGFNRKLKLMPKGFPIANKAKDERLMKFVPKQETSNMIRNKSRPVNNAPPKRINSAACIGEKPLRERIIQLLSMRPYKRLELEAALKRDGCRENIMETLKTVSTFRDNMYHLAKQAHSPNNNCNSNGNSSDSGISVSSNHSPNNNNNNNNSSNNNSTSSNKNNGLPVGKRPGYVHGIDGFQTKRQRISHFVKQEPPPFTSRGLGNSLAAVTNSSSFSTTGSSFNPLSDDRLTNDPHKTVAVKQELKPSPLKSFVTSASAGSVAVSIAAAAGAVSAISGIAADDVRFTPPAESKYSPRKEPPHVLPSVFSTNTILSSADVRSSTCSNASSNGLPDDEQKSYPDLISRMALEKKPPYEKPKYMKDYVTIMSTEQRSRYKADFSKIFEEYQRVHKEVDQVRDLFAQLSESLKKHKKGSKGYAKVENDIVKKYYALKSNRNFQDAKRRYEYLHEKLSHIKNLVNEYDDKVRKQYM